MKAHTFASLRRLALALVVVAALALLVSVGSFALAGFLLIWVMMSAKLPFTTDAAEVARFERLDADSPEFFAAAAAHFRRRALFRVPAAALVVLLGCAAIVSLVTGRDTLGVWKVLELIFVLFVGCATGAKEVSGLREIRGAAAGGPAARSHAIWSAAIFHSDEPVARAIAKRLAPPPAGTGTVLAADPLAG